MCKTIRVLSARRALGCLHRERLDKTMSVILLGGSPSPQSSTSRLLQHVGDKLAVYGHRIIRLEARELDPHALLAADCGEPGIVRLLAQIAAADAVVVATPVYKAAYSGLLKAVLDLLP